MNTPDKATVDIVTKRTKGALKAWLKSEEGQECSNAATLQSPDAEKHLNNRLALAWIDGWCVGCKEVFDVAVKEAK